MNWNLQKLNYNWKAKYVGHTKFSDWVHNSEWDFWTSAGHVRSEYIQLMGLSWFRKCYKVLYTGWVFLDWIYSYDLHLFVFHFDVDKWGDIKSAVYVWWCQAAMCVCGHDNLHSTHHFSVGSYLQISEAHGLAKSWIGRGVHVAWGSVDGVFGDTRVQRTFYSNKDVREA